MESDKEKKEGIQLYREVKISELILAGKKNELNNEKNRTSKLNKNIRDVINKNEETKENIEKLKEEIKKIILINENIEKENNCKKEERQKLFEELKFGQPQPLEENKDDKNEDDYEGYEIDET